MNARVSRAALVASMCIFGTIGLARRLAPVPSGFLAMVRGLMGAAFLLLLLGGKRPKLPASRREAGLLLLSGTMLGLNWILLFEAYRFTTVAVATLCYYMAPVLILLSSPLVLKEPLTVRKSVCAAGALLGMALVTGLTGTGGAPDPRGVALGLGAASLYAAIVLVNKGIRGVTALERTLVQLAAAGMTLLPYVLLTGELGEVAFTPALLGLLCLVGLVHTGVAYALYFGSMEALDAQTLALLSYLDPAVAVLLSALVLREPLGAAQALGAALILCAAAASELPAGKHTH